jgi:hypothetical protein
LFFFFCLPFPALWSGNSTGSIEKAYFGLKGCLDYQAHLSYKSSKKDCNMKLQLQRDETWWTVQDPKQNAAHFVIIISFLTVGSRAVLQINLFGDIVANEPRTPLTL